MPRLAQGEIDVQTYDELRAKLREEHAGRDTARAG
jgi:hypothetical protein